MYLLGVSLLLMVATQAQTNQEMIIGNWAVDSTDISAIMFLDADDIAEMMMMAEIFSPEVFLAEFGFAAPQTDEEWAALAENGIVMPIDSEEMPIGPISFSSDTMIMYADGDMIILSYSFINDSTISVSSPDDDEFPFSEFNILNLSENNLVLSALDLFEDGEGEDSFSMILYCTVTGDLVMGCTDADAINYNADANVDDGSCEYPYLCDEDELLLTMYDEANDGWEGAQLLINGSLFTLGDGDMGSDCIDKADCYIYSSIEGDFDDEASWSITNQEGDVFFEGGLPYFSYNDMDDDMVCDDMDNCIDISNSDQLDTDGDDEGDACDYDDGLSIEVLSKENVTLLRMVNTLGKEYSIHPKGELLFYIYSNGLVKKEIKF